MKFRKLDLQSESATKPLLRSLHPHTSAARQYEAAAHVAACARQAAAFEAGALAAGWPVEPVLRYYALLHWMKAFLYLLDPAFPPSTSVLQHGVSVRRNKRQPYRWPLEAVYVYKEGILQSFAAIVEPGVTLPQRWVVGDLMGSVPAGSHALRVVHPEFQHVYPLVEGLFVPRRIAANRGLTVDEWKDAYLRAAGVELAPSEDDDGAAPEPTGYLRLPVPPDDHPWRRHEAGRNFLSDGTAWPAWLVHVVLLYTLSALCRYNAIEWSDIVTWNNEHDAYLVRDYLNSYPLEQCVEDVFRAAAAAAEAVRAGL